MLSSFLFLVIVVFPLVSCSKDKPAPVAPAGKTTTILEAPPAPTNLRFEAVTDSSCRVRWDAAEGATDYDVNYKPAVGGRWTNEPHKGVRLYNTIYDLEPNTEYRWAVRAENRSGASNWVFGENFTTSDDFEHLQPDTSPVQSADPFNIELIFLPTFTEEEKITSEKQLGDGKRLSRPVSQPIRSKPMQLFLRLLCRGPHSPPFILRPARL